jgi:hypothetical protein
MSRQNPIIMDNTENKKKNKDTKGSGLKPDPQTLHTTDPQEKMKGPVSSTIQDIKHNAEKNDEVSQEDATRKRDDQL